MQNNITNKTSVNLCNCTLSHFTQFVFKMLQAISYISIHTVDVGKKTNLFATQHLFIYSNLVSDLDYLNDKSWMNDFIQQLANQYPWPLVARLSIHIVGIIFEGCLCSLWCVSNSTWSFKHGGGWFCEAGVEKHDDSRKL